MNSFEKTKIKLPRGGRKAVMVKTGFSFVYVCKVLDGLRNNAVIVEAAREYLRQCG